jgi:alpha-tubulin suppressor-like RCC1 family protein
LSELKPGQKIVDAALGFQHTILITEKGEAYGCGKADSYQIQPFRYHYYQDIMTITHIDKPDLIWGKRRVVKAACGNKHSILLTEDNKLYALGSNKFGQCGLEFTKQDSVKKLTEVNFPFLSGEQIIDIKCGSFHTLILTNRHLYFMGSTKRNQNPFSSN